MDFNDIWAAVLKMAVNQARQITDEQKALEVKSLYKQWEKQINKELQEGEFVQHNDKLYKVLQTHTVQTDWEPGAGTESLFAVIDKKHAGTLDDPIPYEGNMEIFNEKYYIQNDVLYLCIRDSGTPLHHDLKDLVDVYVQVV